MPQLVGIPVDAKRTGAGQFVLAVPSAQKPDAEHVGAAGRQQVPDRVPDDVALVSRYAEPPVRT